MFYIKRRKKLRKKRENRAKILNKGDVLATANVWYGKDDTVQYCKALAAAGSDARMNGCELPVVINSGSGNQGMTTSLPVIEYAKELNVSDSVKQEILVITPQNYVGK